MGLYSNFAALYGGGEINANFTGGLTAYAYVPSTSGSAVKKPSVTLGSSAITLKVTGDGNGSGGSYFAENKIDLSRFRTLNIEVSSATTSGAYIRFGVTSAKANKYVVDKALSICTPSSPTASNKTFSVDISDLTGAYYLFINLYANYDKTITFTKCWLE